MLVESEFQPPRWLRNAHLQTLAASLLRPRPTLDYRIERLELPDGDFVDLAWRDQNLPADAPVLVVLHGLTGSVESRYARAMMNCAHARGWRSVLLQFRGESGVPNRLARSYHSGDTGDLNFLLRTLRSREPKTPVAAVGYSLGGNVLLKYLGEQGRACMLKAAVAVSPPFDLGLCADAINQGFSRVYQASLLREMRAAVQAKLGHVQFPMAFPPLQTLRCFRQFDDAITAPLHGFRDVDHYYREASCRHYLQDIRVPALILHAQDDPFMSAAVVPAAETLADSLRLELSAHGGHVAFIAAGAAGRPYFWLERRIPEFIGEFLPFGELAPLAAVSS